MTNNPDNDEPELIDLGVDVDEEGWNEWQQGIQQAAASVQSLDDVIAQLNERGSSLSGTFDDIAEQAKSFTENASSDLGQFVDQLNGIGPAAEQNIGQLADQLGAADDRLKQYMADLEQTAQDQADMSGAGAFGDTGGEDDGGGGGTGGGSLYGVARGFRAGAGIGRIAGLGSGSTAAFTGIADIIYLQQGFDQLSETLSGMPGLLGEVATEGAAAGGSLGTVLAVLGPLAIAGIAIGAAFSAFNDIITQGKDAIDAAVKSQQQYNLAIQDGTTNELKAQNEKLQAQKNGDDATLAQVKNSLDAQIDAAAKAHDDIDPNFAARYKDMVQQIIDAPNKAARDSLATTLAREVDPTGLAGIHALTDQLKDLSQKSADAGAQIQTNTQAMGSDNVALNDAAAAVITSTDAHIRQAQQFAADDQLTMQAAQNKLTALAANRQAELDAAEHLQNFAYANDLSGKALLDNQAAVKAHTDAATADADEINHINDVSLGLISTRQQEQQAIKDADAATKEIDASLKQVTDAQNAYNKAIQSAQDNAVNAINNAQLQERNAEQQYTEGSIQDVYKRQQVQTASDRQRETDEVDTANKITDVRTKLGEEELSITTNYNRQIFDDQIKFGQDIQKLQTQANNTAATDLQNHLDKLNQIQQTASQNEADDIANRDFQKLAKDEQTKQNQTNAEDTSYTRREEALQTHLAQQEDALATSLTNTEAKQKLDEERKAADAQTKTDQEIDKLNADERRKQEVISTSEQQKLQDITTSENEQIAVLRQGLVNKITLIQIEENQREQIAQQTDQAIIAQHNQMINQLHAEQANTSAYRSDFGGAASSAVPQAIQQGTWAGSTPAAPVISTPPQQQQSGFDVSSIVGAIANGVQGLFGL